MWFHQREFAIYPVLSVFSFFLIGKWRFKYLLNCFRFVVTFHFSQFHLFTLFFSRSVCVSVFDINLFERENERVSERMGDPKKNNDWNQFSGWVFLRTTILLETTFASDIRFWLLLSFALFFRPFIRELINVRLQVLLFWHPVRLLLCHYCRLFIHL